MTPARNRDGEGNPAHHAGRRSAKPARSRHALRKSARDTWDCNFRPSLVAISPERAFFFCAKGHILTFKNEKD